MPSISLTSWIGNPFLMTKKIELDSHAPLIGKERMYAGKAADCEAFLCVFPNRPNFYGHF